MNNEQNQDVGAANLHMTPNRLAEDRSRNESGLSGLPIIPKPEELAVEEDFSNPDLITSQEDVPTATSETTTENPTTTAGRTTTTPPTTTVPMTTTPPTTIPPTTTTTTKPPITTTTPPKGSESPSTIPFSN